MGGDLWYGGAGHGCAWILRGGCSGDAVNLETDILARYVEKMLGMDKKGNGFAGRHKPGAAENNNSEPELTEAFLLRHGF